MQNNLRMQLAYLRLMGNLLFLGMTHLWLTCHSFLCFFASIFTLNYVNRPLHLHFIWAHYHSSVNELLWWSMEKNHTVHVLSDLQRFETDGVINCKLSLEGKITGKFSLTICVYTVMWWRYVLHSMWFFS